MIKDNWKKKHINPQEYCCQSKPSLYDSKMLVLHYSTQLDTGKKFFKKKKKFHNKLKKIS